MYDKIDDDLSQMRDQFGLFLNILLIILFPKNKDKLLPDAVIFILNEVLPYDVCSFH